LPELRAPAHLWHGAAMTSIDALSARCVDLISRGELAAKLREARPLRIKYGADPSAPDLHLGHVVGLNKLREFQDAGHTVVFIIGDFTAMIGDPSGRSQTRKPLSREQVRANAETYRRQVFTVLDPARTEMRFNSEWLAPMGFESVVRLAAHVTVAQMLAREDFANRHADNAPISLVEFLYPLIQAYDSVVVEADLELGGTDQLFNLLLGRELQKQHGQTPQVVMTLPLLEGLDGTQKMSKSLNNYVGITDPPQEMFGKIMSISDDLMWRYYELVLCADAAELEAARALHPRAAKDRLAQSIVARFHGADAAAAASAEFARVFSQSQLPRDIPSVAISETELPLHALLVRCGLASSNGEAKRLIEQGAVRIDEERITDLRARIPIRAGMVVRAGKRGFARVS
jgi:tyrosyl-tRNA synthetase